MRKKESESYAVYNSPVGRLKISYNDRAITAITMGHSGKGGKPGALSDRCAAELAEYFEGKRESFDVPIELHGTPFQQRVWAALLDIPYGETRTYGEIAAAAGNPKACRAAGMANHNNPICIIVPCHRVIGKDGSLTGYGGGLENKKLLLDLEAKFKK